MHYYNQLPWKAFDSVARLPDGKHKFSFGPDPFKFFPFRLGITNHLTPNFHDYFEIVYCIKGSGWYEISSHQRPITEGTILFLGPYDMHTFWSNPENPVHFIAFFFMPDYIFSGDNDQINRFYIEPFIAEGNCREIATGSLHYKKITESINSIIKLEDKKNALQYRKPHLLNILLQIREHIESEFPLSPIKTSPATRLGKVFSFLHNNFEKPLSIDEIAEIACLSRYHFCRTFRIVTGNTCTDYLNRIRVDHAKIKLNTTDHSVSFIAQEVGFRNLSHFNSRFKSYSGFTPLEYRRFIRNNRS